MPQFSVKCINEREKCLNKTGDTLNLDGSGRQSGGIAYKVKVQSQVGSSVNNNNNVRKYHKYFIIITELMTFYERLRGSEVWKDLGNQIQDLTSRYLSAELTKMPDRMKSLLIAAYSYNNISETF